MGLEVRQVFLPVCCLQRKPRPSPAQPGASRACAKLIFSGPWDRVQPVGPREMSALQPQSSFDGHFHSDAMAQPQVLRMQDLRL